MSVDFLNDEAPFSSYDEDGTVAQAQQRFPGSINADDACNSTGFFAYLEKYHDKDLAKRYGGYYAQAESLKRALDENPEILSSLSNGALANMSSILGQSGHPDVKDLNFLVNKEYNVFEDADYKALDLQNKLSITEKLRADPLVKHASEHWKDMSLEARLEVGQRIHDLHSEVYGYESLVVKVEHMKDETVSARVSPDGFAYNTNTGDPDKENPAIIDNDFAKFLQTSIHENEHNFQVHMMRQFRQIHAEELRWEIERGLIPGEMSGSEYEERQKHMAAWADKNMPDGMSDPLVKGIIEGSGIREVAEMMDTNFSFYKALWDRGSSERYEAVPQEKHAHNAFIVKNAVLEEGDTMRALLKKELDTALADGEDIQSNRSAIFDAEDISCKQIASPIKPQ